MKRHPIWAITACTGLGVSQCAWGWIVQATPEENYGKLYREIEKKTPTNYSSGKTTYFEAPPSLDHF